MTYLTSITFFLVKLVKLHVMQKAFHQIQMQLNNKKYFCIYSAALTQWAKSPIYVQKFELWRLKSRIFCFKHAQKLQKFIFLLLIQIQFKD